MRWLAVILLMLCGRSLASPIGVAYYDVDRLYDTIPSPFYDDKEFTPKGKYLWDTKRYMAKISRTAQVIDSLRLPIIALYGVENEQVVRDIVVRCREDYSYTHRTLNYLDGLDFTLLYFGDKFYPRYTKSYRDWLYVEFESLHEQWSLGIYLARGSYNMRTTAPPHDSALPDNILVMGRLKREDITRLKLQDPLREAERSGYGDSRIYDRWQLKSRIAIDHNAEVLASGIYIKRWLMGDKHAPKATLDSEEYRDGYSQYLPIYIYFKQKDGDNK